MNTSIKKYRYELKFIMSKNTANLLKYKLSLIMKKDKHYEDYYKIKSLYFDDIYNSIYNEKIDGIKEREKYRIRIYNNDKSFISIELKGRNNTLTYKERDLINEEEYRMLINKEYERINIGNRKLLSNFIKDKKNKNLIPSVIVDYNRLAYVYNNDIRITFDEDIKSGLFNYNLFDNNINLINALEDGEVILEVKYNYSLPSFIKELLKNINMTRISLSKYAICVEKKGINL